MKPIELNPEGILLEQLAPSLFNPPGRINKETIGELADSIHAHGIIQPVVISHDLVDTAKQRFPVVVGERRRLAIEWLRDTKRWPADRLIPYRLVTGDESELRTISLIENVQREDLHPLDEATAFRMLIEVDAEKWTTATIGKTIGKTVRHVELRLALLEKLTPQVRKAFRAGEINLAAARELTAGRKARQGELLGHIKDGHLTTAVAVKQAVAGAGIPLDLAIFDPAKFQGEIVTDPDDGTKHVVDSKRFLDAQRAEIAKRIAELVKTWAWVEFFDGAEGEYFKSHEYEKTKDKKRAGVAISLDWDGRVDIVEGVAKREDTKPAGGPAPTPAERPEFTRDHLARAHNTKTEVLQKALMLDRHAAMKLAILGMMGANRHVYIRAEMPGNDDCVLAPELSDASDAFCKNFGKLLEGGHEPSVPSLMRLGGWLCDDKMAAMAWSILGNTPLATIEKIFALLVASRFGTFNHETPELGDSELVCSVVSDLDIKMKFEVDETYLETCRKPQLLTLLDAAAVRTPEVAGAGAETLTNKALKAALGQAITAGALTGFIPRELRFGSRAALSQATPEEMKAAKVRRDAAAKAAREAAKAKPKDAQGSPRRGMISPGRATPKKGKKRISDARRKGQKAKNAPNQERKGK